MSGAASRGYPEAPGAAAARTALAAPQAEQAALVVLAAAKISSAPPAAELAACAAPQERWRAPLAAQAKLVATVPRWSAAQVQAALAVDSGAEEAAA